MEKHIELNKQTLILLSILRDLQKMRFLLLHCKGFTNRLNEVNRLISLLTNRKRTQFQIQKHLMDFKKRLLGMNSFTDFPITLKKENPIKKAEIQLGIKETANELWLLINDGY